MTGGWDGSHTEEPPTLPEVNARWCAGCGRLILTDDGRVTEIGSLPCTGGAS